MDKNDLTKNSNIERINTWLSLMEKLDSEGLCDMYDPEQMVFIWPYAPEILGMNELRGNSELMRKTVKLILAGFKTFKVVEKTIINTEDPNIFVVIWKGESEWTSNQKYCNSYINLFKFRDGKIYEIVEYYNPLTILEAMGKKVA